MNQIEPGVQYNYVYDEDEYMIQEEEWDRDLLLDPAWEKQQRKVSRSPVPAVCGLGSLARGYPYPRVAPRGRWMEVQCCPVSSQPGAPLERTRPGIGTKLGIFVCARGRVRERARV